MAIRTVPDLLSVSDVVVPVAVARAVLSGATRPCLVPADADAGAGAQDRGTDHEDGDGTTCQEWREG